MKATRSSSIGGSARRRSSSTNEKKEGDGSGQKPLRRSTRDREQATSIVHTPASPVSSPTTQRTRRRARGLPSSSAQRGDTAAAATPVDDVLVTPKQGRTLLEGADTAINVRSTTRGSASKSARKQQETATIATAVIGGSDLIAVRKNGFSVRVTLLVNGQQFMPSIRHQKISGESHQQPSTKKLSPTATVLGQDGNLFYCAVCRGFGDVVCCDSCPLVYHMQCIPVGSESRLSLENDDDPWYCPECLSKRTPTKQEPQTKRVEGSSRRTIKHRCQECQQSRSDLSLRPCEVCAVYIHNPSCRGATPPSEGFAVLCSSCRAEAALTQEEQELQVKKKRRLDEEERERQVAEVGTSGGSKEPVAESLETNAGRRTRSKSIDGADPVDRESKMQEEYYSPMEEGPELTPSVGQKRKAREAESPDDLTKSERKRKKKRKKKRKRDSDAHLPSDEASMDMAEASPQPDRDESSGFPGGEVTPRPLQGPPTQATPAFHFYLSEQRPKIEKVLSRKHRYFNRLPKGGERNALIAKEAAMQWVRLSSVDQKKYINMSMHDYESRIIAWKEEKNIRDMLVEPEGQSEAIEETPGEDTGNDDHILTYEMHERLYLGTSVGSKPYKPEPNESHNRVLLDLLRDMRFHPLPMISISRPETETCSSLDTSKLAIRHFDVHGPIATSVGDECLGCTRGWPHFCPVLQRRIPAVEHRSRLQPAASALLSSRVGLGLRPRLERIEIEGEDEANPGKSALLNWRDAPDSKIRFVPSGTLGDPSSRADDIVQFIEEVVAMKIPVPPAPVRPSALLGNQAEATQKKSLLGRGALPTRNKRSDGIGNEVADSINNGYASINKCGRCRTIIMNESGCVQCRRAQLVINMSKRQPPQADQQGSLRPEKAGLLKMQTAMLGRVITKEAIGENQVASDKKISTAILRERWSPSAILPPEKALAPSPSRKRLEKVENRTEEEPKHKERTDIKSDKNVNDESLDQNELRPRNRRTASAPAAFESNDAEKQNVARQHREEADKISKRTLSIACNGILLALMRRDPLLLFAQPVSAENYEKIVKKPIDFSKIRSRVLNGNYHSLGAFVSDVRLLCENALIFNPPGSIYSKTAKEILDVLFVMQRRASKWMNAIKHSHSSFWRKSPKKRKQENDGASDVSDFSQEDPLKQLRQTWPEGVEMFENSDYLKDLLTSDFSRTKENEAAFYGSLATRRAAKAAEVCLAPYPDTGGVHSAVVKRSKKDEELRQFVDAEIAKIVNPIQLREIATGREETIVRLLRRVQSRRLERRIGSENGCARCDGMGLDHEMKAVMNADARWGRSKKKGDSESENRVAASRLELTTGLASAKTRQRIAKLREQSQEEAFESVNDVCVSLRGSRIHGWGLFAEQPFKKGDVVAEYVGECVGLPVADAREKLYQDMRIKDYQFRLDDSQIIDATMKGGLGRYINHNCNPNCKTTILSGKPPNQHLRRVLILAQRDIAPREELTYDYQFPLELNLEARIPCNCQSDVCRGFMNWDLPEKVSAGTPQNFPT